MALSPVQSGAPLARTPFPDDGWYRLWARELDDGLVSIYRKGNELQCRFSGDNDDFRHRIDPLEGVDAFLDALRNFSLMRIGNAVRFITPGAENAQVPSMVDPTVMITHRMWGVTLVADTGYCTKKTENRKECNSSGFIDKITGHAYLHIETLNPRGELASFRAHIVTLETITLDNGEKERVSVPNGRAKVRYGYAHPINPNWPRTEPILRSSALVQRMIDDIQRQIRADEEAIAAENPYPIRFSATSPNPQRNIHNCDSWVLQQARVATISIPVIEPPLPGKGWYVPCYQIRPLKEIAEKTLSKKKGLQNWIGDRHFNIIAFKRDNLASDKEFIIGEAIILPLCSLLVIGGHLFMKATFLDELFPQVTEGHEKLFAETRQFFLSLPNQIRALRYRKKSLRQKQITLIKNSITGKLK